MTGARAAGRWVAPPDGLQEFDPLRDLAAVIELLEIGFRDDLLDRDRRRLHDLKALSESGPLLRWLLRAVPGSRTVFGGYVWYEDGRMIGNVSLIGHPNERWTIANVVTHPSARRRGIARRLMVAAIRAADQRGASRLQLHVRRDNGPATALYRALGFTPSGAALTLRLAWPEATAPPTGGGDGLRVTRWQRPTDPQARALIARAGVPPDSGPGVAVRRASRRGALRQRLDDWLHGRRRIALAARSDDGVHGLALTLVEEQSDADHQMSIVLDRRGRGRAEAPLIAETLRRLPKDGERGLEIDIPAGEEALEATLRALGFQEQQVLERHVLELKPPSDKP